MHGLAADEGVHDWKVIAPARAAAAQLVRGETLIVPTAFPTPVKVALEWLRIELPPEFRGVDPSLPIEWELRLALAIELIRAAYRQLELPIQLRALGIVSGADALEETAASLAEAGIASGR
jgi:hypothetical protein